MRRSTILERLEQKPEALLSFITRYAKGLKNLALDRRVVDSDGASADFEPVEDDVISAGTNPGRIGLEQGQALVSGGSERVVQGKEAPFLFVPFQERELGNPDKTVLLLTEVLRWDWTGS